MRHEHVYLNEENTDRVSYLLYDRGSTNRSERERMKKILIRAVRHGLTERQRYCITRYYLDGVRMKNIAKELGVSKSTVTRHIKAAEMKLRKVASYYER